MADDTNSFANESIPSSYASWRHYIEVKCDLKLTPEFLQDRIAVLSDPGHEESKSFAKSYGDAYREQVLTWYQRAAKESA